MLLSFFQSKLLCGKVPCTEESRKALVSGHIARIPRAGPRRKRSTRDRTEPFLMIPAGNCRRIEVPRITCSKVELRGIPLMTCPKVEL